MQKSYGMSAWHAGRCEVVLRGIEEMSARWCGTKQDGSKLAVRRLI